MFSYSLPFTGTAPQHGQMQKVPRPKHRGRINCIYIAAIFIILVLPAYTQAEIRQIDPYTGTRTIPNIVTGGTTTLTDSEIIDIVILGDGYIVDVSTSTDETEDFFHDAHDWYDRIFDPVNGIRPFSLFPEAFRVRANFKASSERASGPDDADRKSYYKVRLKFNVDSSLYEVDQDISWWDDDDTVNQTFRDRLFDAIDEVTPLNTAQYLALKMSDQADVHSHLVPVMLIRRNDGGQPGGMTVNIPKTSGTRIVRAALGVNWQHEFSHAFAYLKDEYIGTRGSTSTDSDPAPAARSVFNVINVTHSNDRCDSDMLWSHLAPGGIYNPNVNSLIGNLFKGGKAKENGAWHSEYSCLINGTHENYFCDDVASSPNTNLRDHEHFCFWCEEIVAMRILEKTGEFWRPGDPADINVRGITWYSLWLSSLRDDYYTYFDIPTLIREKNACYDTFYGNPCPPEFPNCADACDTGQIPPCIHGCTIREVGNAMYVESSAGPGGDGSRLNPYDDIPTAISESYDRCGNPHLIIIKPGSYPAEMSYDVRSTWLADDCNGVVKIGD